MKKRLLPTLLIIIFVSASLPPLGITLSAEQNNPASSIYDRTFTLNVEPENHRSVYTLYVTVPPSLYDYYRGKTHNTKGEREYAKFVTPDAVKNIAKNIRNITNSDEEFANDVLMFVRQIPYSVSGQKYPIEAIVDNSGDCDVLSFLAASIMTAGGLDVVLIVYRGSSISHMNVGVYLPRNPLYATSDPGPSGLEYNNKTYWITETTPSGNWKVGELPESFANLSTTVISLEKQEASSPAYISSSINNPLSPSSISITLSLEKTTAGQKEGAFKISGSISPRYSGKNVVLYISKDGSSYQTFRTATENLGNYSLIWNVTSPGTYGIRTSLLDFSSYASSDSETITVFVGSYLQGIGNEPDGALASSDITGYSARFPSRGFNQFLKYNLAGTNVSLSGEFMVLNSGQTMANSERTITIPAREQMIILSRRRMFIVKIPEQTVPVQGNQLARNQLGFFLQDNNGNYSASVRLFDDSDLPNMEKQLGNNATFMNATTSIKENTWYKAVTKISEDEISTELHDENGAILQNTITKDDSVDMGESGIFVSFEPYDFIAFKNLKVETLDQPPIQTVDDTQLPTNEVEPLAPYSILLIPSVMVGAAIIYLRKRLKAKNRITLPCFCQELRKCCFRC
jgi:hypothetical protein